ncbi:DUF3307 domain-containing protein [Nonlabens antarcticus]|uniref:DUF3307 domain-containing protein n=1 Tax=Nonlabens antarcticus TaxID=392714 RepID=UPI001890D83E|nr:DUF3307 domain-containing protein [Nonlabens antarcticus]
MALLIKLLIAHLLGDFVFQTQKSVKHKEKHKLKSIRLYVHALLHGLLALIALWDLSLWYIALVIAISHLLIDAAKLYSTNKNNKRWLYLTDQVAHVAVIITIWLLYDGTLINFEIKELPFQFWALVLCILFLTTPVAIALKTFFTRWKLDSEVTGVASLKNAGKWIGMIERLLIFIFVVMGHFEAVGFLITAKSVFRFGDLSKAKNMKLTEYVLIGTLISFGIAILTGLAFQQIVLL